MLGHSQTWITYNYICVGVAYAMLSMSLFLMPINLATKGYVGMGIIFLSGSLVTLVKTLHDLRVQSCLLYTSPSPRDATLSRMPSSA